MTLTRFNAERDGEALRDAYNQGYAIGAARGFDAGVQETIARLSDARPGGELRMVVARQLALEHGMGLGSHAEEDQLDFDARAGDALRYLAAALSAPNESGAGHDPSDLRTPVGDGLAVKPLGHVPPPVETEEDARDA